LGGYLLGIRDRHMDNMMLINNQNSLQFLHIDFGFILDTGPIFDAQLISIPTGKFFDTDIG
jgi:phosphatidylinositol kinase/protein kinase (PI-3  family)